MNDLKPLANPVMPNAGEASHPRDRSTPKRFFALLRMTAKGGAACAFLALALSVIIGNSAFAAETYSAGKWSDETLDAFSRIPIQDGGRVKPLSTYARFTLLKMNGKTRLDLHDMSRGDVTMARFTRKDIPRIDAMEWLLDCLYFPEKAKDYQQFLVDNSEVVTAFGGEAKLLRDRYSFNELSPYREKLFTLAQEFSVIEDKDRSPIQRQMLFLAHNLNHFEGLIHYLDFARAEIPTEGSRLLDRAFPGRESLAISDLLRNSDDVQKSVQAILMLREEQTTPEEQARFKEEEERFLSFFDRVEASTFQRDALHIIPPANGEEADWRTPHNLLEHLFTSTANIDSEIEYIAALERTAKAADKPIEFAAAAQELSGLAAAQAKARGEYAKVPIEISYYNAKFFFYAQWLFVLASIMVAVSWLFMGSKNFNRATVVSILIPWALLVTGITYRCIIRNRPPITTLYETILFIAAAIVLVALIIEYINRQRIGIAIAAFMGTFGLFLANKFEMNDKQDTMPSLVAVLDTNFWLSTHVTIVTTGYAAGLLGGAVGIVYIFGKLFNFKKNDKQFYKTLSRMVYGIVCFGLIFSFVGTVLGGIWANYSWGRFWGWDPKENGALLIVLGNLAILHARMGGYIRDLGVSMCAVANGMVVAFSWWGVNLLGVGLHSYGFTSGIWGALMIFWVTQSIVLFAGVVVYVRDRVARKLEASPSLPPEPIAK